MAVKTNAQLKAGRDFVDVLDTIVPTPVTLADVAATSLSKDVHQGRVNLVPDATQDNTYTLPAPAAAGEYYRFVYAGVAADTENVLISSGAGSSVFLKGSVNHLDTDADNAALYINGTSHQLLTLVNPGAFEINCLSISDTVWQVWGSVLSADVPTIAN
tara:strand:+ start:208 stop:684 length:477 start_codon:yes stop_codon:yes gene_type:complete